MLKVGVDNIIVNELGQVLLIQRSAQSKNYPSCWGFVGGWIDEGEDVRTALKREAKEEIGVVPVNHVYAGFYQDQLNINPDVSRIVLPHLCTIFEKDFKLQASEIKSVRWFTVTEALEMDLAYDHKDTLQKAISSGFFYSYVYQLRLQEMALIANDNSEQVFQNGVPRLIDHVCYRTTSEEEYIKVKMEVTTFGRLVSENIINGREIAVFRLNYGLQILGQSVYFIEVASPSEKYTVSGFQHFEIMMESDYAGQESQDIAGFVVKYTKHPILEVAILQKHGNL